RRRDRSADIADAHSAVPADPDRGASYDGFDTLVSIDDAAHRERAADVGVVTLPEGAVNLVPTPDHAARRTAPHLADPKRLRAHLAAAAPSRLCLLDWSDHGPPFR